MALQTNLLHHTAFNCKNRAAQEAFYTKHFGFKRARVFHEGTPKEFVMLRLGSTCIELFNAPPEGKDAVAGPQNVGFKHFAFEVPNIEAAIKKLNDDGIKTEPISDCNHLVPNLKICFFTDPEGNRLELMENWSDQSS